MTPEAEPLFRAVQAAPDPAAAVLAFEARFWTVPLYADATLLEAASGRYEALRRQDGARLLRDLARAMARRGVAGAAGDAAAVLEAGDPGEALQHRLELLDGGPDHRRAAALIRDVFAHAGAPISTFWVHYRAALVFGALRCADEAFLFASMVLQIEPAGEACLLPAREVLRRLFMQRQWDDAAHLLRTWRQGQPGRLLLTGPQEHEILARGRAPMAAAPPSRVLVTAEARPAVPVAVFGRGLPYALAELQAAGERPALTLTELADAEVLVARHALAVRGGDGALHPALCVGDQAPSLVAQAIEQARARGEAVETREANSVVLLSDVFAAPNICHFMLDQAARLPLYAQAGIDLDAAVAIGPDLTHPYQREIARRFGAARYLGTGGLGVVRARRLAVLSNCRHLRHPAHVGALWALQLVRRTFGIPDAGQPPGTRRLFVSREDAAGRHLVNETAVAAVLAAFGFERIVPGRMTVAGQAEAFAQASHVVALHGAALANIAFCAPGTHVLEVFHPLYGTYAYAALTPALGLRYAAMVGRDGHSDAPRDNDPALALERKNECMGNDVRADIGELVRWAQSAGLAQ